MYVIMAAFSYTHQLVEEHQEDTIADHERRSMKDGWMYRWM